MTGQLHTNNKKIISVASQQNSVCTAVVLIMEMQYEVLNYSYGDF